MTSSPVRNITLAMETAIAGGSVCLLDDEIEVASITSDHSVSRAEDLLYNIKELLADNGLTTDNIKRIAISVGPGSYTGLRIGISSALGLKTSLGCECIGISTFEALRQLSTDDKKKVVVAVPIGRSELAFSAFVGANEGKGTRMPSQEVVDRNEFSAVISREKPETLIVHDDLYGICEELKGIKIIKTGRNLAKCIGTAAHRQIGLTNLSPIYMVNKKRGLGLF